MKTAFSKKNKKKTLLIENKWTASHMQACCGTELALEAHWMDFIFNRFSLEGGACNKRNHVLIFWMTQFQHVASSTRKSAVNSPASRRRTHVSLWTVRVPELRSQQIPRPRWPHTGQQMVSHCHLEGSAEPYIQSKKRKKPKTVCLHSCCCEHMEEVTPLRAEIPPLTPRTPRQINTTCCPDFKEFSTEALTYHNTMHDVAECKENCNTGTITTVQILCSINRKSDGDTLQILLTVPELQTVH